MKWLFNLLARFRWFCWNVYQRHLRRRPKVPITTTIVIYVRPTGSDVTGDGRSVATAYATMARAVRDVPSHIQPGTVYTIDVTPFVGCAIKHAEVNLTASKDAEERELTVRHVQKLIGEVNE